VALAGATGCLIGSIAAFWIGATGGRPLLLKYGRYLLISQHDADRADAFFQRWGSATAFFSRLLPVVRTYISLPAGIAKMPFLKFCVFTFLGSFPWCLLLAYVGYVIGDYSGALGPIFRSLDIVVVLALVILVALYIWRHIRNDRRARAAHAAAEAQAAAQQQGVVQSDPRQQGQMDGWSQVRQQWEQSMPQQSPQPGQPVQQQGWNAPRQEPFSSQNWGQPAPPPQQQVRGPQAPQQPSQPQQWGQMPTPAPWPSNSENGRNGR
jgi:membrane protein DedA with SNARE-associated domain